MRALEGERGHRVARQTRVNPSATARKVVGEQEAAVTKLWQPQLELEL